MRTLCCCLIRSSGLTRPLQRRQIRQIKWAIGRMAMTPIEPWPAVPTAASKHTHTYRGGKRERAYRILVYKPTDHGPNINPCPSENWVLVLCPRRIFGITRTLTLTLALFSPVLFYSVIAYSGRGKETEERTCPNA